MDETRRDGWIPYCYFDEVIPELRAAPADWIGRYDDGAPGLLDFDGKAPARRLEDGAAETFMEHRGYGDAVLTVTADGSWAVSQPMPVEANYVWCAEIEQGGNSVAVLIADWKEAADSGWGATFEESGPVAISYSWWSDPLPFRFDAAARAFVQVAS